MQHQARLSGDFLTGWFENDDENDPNSFLRERERQQKAKQKADATNENDTPNSLAEWTRTTIDAQRLTQKRQEIHRQKRLGRSIEGGLPEEDEAAIFKGLLFFGWSCFEASWSRYRDESNSDVGMVGRSAAKEAQKRASASL